MVVALHDEAGVLVRIHHEVDTALLASERRAVLASGQGLRRVGDRPGSLRRIIVAEVAHLLSHGRLVRVASLRHVLPVPRGVLTGVEASRTVAE